MRAGSSSKRSKRSPRSCRGAEAGRGSAWSAWGGSSRGCGAAGRVGGAGGGAEGGGEPATPRSLARSSQLAAGRGVAGRGGFASVRGRGAGLAGGAGRGGVESSPAGRAPSESASESQASFEWSGMDGVPEVRKTGYSERGRAGRQPAGYRKRHGRGRWWLAGPPGRALHLPRPLAVLACRRPVAPGAKPGAPGQGPIERIRLPLSATSKSGR